MFIKVKPLTLKEEESQLAGAKPKLKVIEEDEVLINGDFIVMISYPEPKEGIELPHDCAVLVLHTGESLIAKGKVSDYWRRFK